MKLFTSLRDIAGYSQQMIRKVISSDFVFIGCASAVVISLFLKSGVTSVSFITFCSICLLNYSKNWTELIKTRWTLLLPAGLFIWYALWTFVGEPRDGAWNELIKKVTLLLFPFSFLITGKRMEQRKIDIVLMVFVAATIVCSLVCYVYGFYNVITTGQYYLHNDDRDYYYLTYILLTEFVGITPIYLSMMTNMAIVIVITSSLIKKSTWRYLLLLYFSVFVVLVASKIGIICLAGIVGVWLFMSIRQRILAVGIVGGMIVFFVIGIFTIPFLKERFVASFKFNYTEQYGENWNSNAFRAAIWSSTFETIQNRPVLGYGTGAGQAALEETYEKNQFGWGINEHLNAHSEFFASALDLGIPGMIYVVLMLAIPFIVYLKRKDPLGMMFIFIATCYFFIEVILNRQKGIVFFVFFYSLLAWSMELRGQKSPDREPV
jgi:O-antigen ligase